MNKKILIIFIVIFLAVVGVILFFKCQPKQNVVLEQEEAVVRMRVEKFGSVLKNVSLFSLTTAQDIEDNYKDYLDPALFKQWKEDPSKAVGRLASSPWPDRINIISVNRFGSGAYDVKGEIIEMTSNEAVEGGIAAKRSIDLGVVNFDGQWLITGISLGEYVYYDIAAQLEECLPKSDTESKEKCERLINTIDNFEECINAGFSIMKSHPAQCATPDGRIFVEELKTID